jgi:hypothetical protein
MLSALAARRARAPNLQVWHLIGYGIGYGIGDVGIGPRCCVTGAHIA